MRALRRALPHEDIVLVCDHAYAPYPNRPPRVVLDRIGRLADELAARPVKLLLVASAVATDEGLAFLLARLAPLPVIGMDATLAAAGRLSAGVVLAIAGEGCLRSLPFWQATRRVRGPAGIAVAEWPGLRELVEEGRADSEAATALVQSQLAVLTPDVTALALVCPHSSALRGLVEQTQPPGAVIVDGVALAVERVRRQLATSRMQAARRRAGRSVVMSTDPNRANGLALAMRG